MSSKIHVVANKIWKISLFGPDNYKAAVISHYLRNRKKSLKKQAIEYASDLLKGYLNGELNNGYEAWKKTAKFHQGSWWTPWTERLSKYSGKKVAATKTLGNAKYKVIEPAPGRYVKEKSIPYLPQDNKSIITKQ